MDTNLLLWKSFKEGNWAAYTNIYNSHFSLLSNYGRKFTSDIELIEDAVHDLFTKLWASKSKLGEPVSVKNYLYKAFRNTLFVKMQSLSRFDNLDDDYSFHYEVGYDAVITDKENRHELQNRMQQMIKQLPARQREIVFLRFYEGMSYEEIADVMAISVNSSYKLLYKAINKLQELLKAPNVLVVFHLLGAVYLRQAQIKNLF